MPIGYVPRRSWNWRRFRPGFRLPPQAPGNGAAPHADRRGRQKRGRQRMAGVAEPGTGLVFYELSHEWGHGVPALPGFEDVTLYRSTQHAKNGVMAHRLRMMIHSGTHLNAPTP